MMWYKKNPERHAFYCKAIAQANKGDFTLLREYREKYCPAKKLPSRETLSNREKQSRNKKRSQYNEYARAYYRLKKGDPIPMQIYNEKYAAA